MAGTPKTLQELQTLLANNSSQAIGAPDAQDFLATVYGQMKSQVVSGNTVLNTNAVAVHVSAAAQVTLPPGTDGALVTVTRDIRDVYNTRVWSTRNSTRTWVDLATSADNKYQVAIIADLNPDIYLSNDYGDTWVALSSTTAFSPTSNLYCTKCAMSADGLVMSIVYYDSSGGAIMTSIDHGVSWYAGVDSPKLARMLNMSPDGTILLASNSEEDIYISTDSGVTWSILAATWTPEGSPASVQCTRKWSRSCISADNRYMLVTVGGFATELTYPVSNSPAVIPCNFDIATNRVSVPVGYVLVENQYIMFKDVTGPTNVAPVAYHTPNNYYKIRTGSILGNTFQLDDYAGTPLTMSGVNGSGSYQQHAAFGGRFWVSQDYGATFNEIYQYTNTVGVQPLLVADTRCCAMSSSGQHMVTASRRNLPGTGHLAGLLYISHDYGSTWEDALNDGIDHEWSALTMSTDGSIIYAAVGNLGTGSPTGYMWSSYDSGATWHQELVGIDSDWQGLSMSADAAKVSAIKLSKPISISNSTQKAFAAGVVTILPSAGKTIRRQNSYVLTGDAFSATFTLKSNDWHTVHESVVVEKSSADFSYHRAATRWFTSSVTNYPMQNGGLDPDVLYAIPFLVSGSTVQIDALGMYFRNTTAGGFVQLGIYNNLPSNEIASLVVTGGAVSANVGFQSASIAPTTLAANTLYWLVCLASDSVDVYAQLPAQQINILGYNIGTKQGYTGYTAVNAYGALPIVFPTGTLVSAPYPSIFIRRQ